MLIHGQPTRTIWPAGDGAVEIIDQTRLPHAVEIVRLTGFGDAVRAIADMQVRGAPLIGATAAWGLALAMRQVPALVLPDGTLMTESAAILIWLAETYPQGRLGPPPGDPMRPVFLRWMSFVSSAIYALFWIRDKPDRLVGGEAAAAEIDARTRARITECWAIMDSQITPGRYLLGDELSVLDLYVAVISRWASKGRNRFYRAAPGMADPIRRVDADPRLERFWVERFPFKAGWEGE